MRTRWSSRRSTQAQARRCRRAWSRRQPDRCLADMVGLQSGEPRRHLQSEFISWPVTMLILVLAFGSLVAAGLPLMLTIVGLIASAGLLFLGTLVSPISIWAMNFALMSRLPWGSTMPSSSSFASGPPTSARSSVPSTRWRRRWTHRQSRALLRADRAGLALGGDVGAEPRFPLDGLGIIVAVLFVLAATLTLLPAVLAKLGPGSTACRFRGSTAASIARRASRGGASCSGAGRTCSVASPWSCYSSWRYRCSRFEQGCPRSRWCRPATNLGRAMSRSRRGSGRAHRAPPDRRPGRGEPSGHDRREQRPRHRPVPTVPVGRRRRGAGRGGPHQRSLEPPAGATIDRLRSELPSGALIGGPAAETTTSRPRWRPRHPW